MKSSVTCLVLIAFLMAAPAYAQRRIVVGYLPIIGFANFFVAMEKGYFAAQGLDAKLERFRTGGDMIPHLAKGTIDVGAGSVASSLFNAISDGLEVKVVGGTNSQPRGYNAVPLLVRKALFDRGEVKGVADLKGRKVAINVKAGSAEYLAAQALAKGNLTVDDVELVTMPFPSRPEALTTGAVDAAILPEPLATRAVKMGAAVILMRGDEIDPNNQTGILYYGRNFLREPELGRRFMVALMKAHRELQGEFYKREDIAQIINKYTGIPVPVVKSATGYYIDPDVTLVTDSLMKMQRYYLGRGYLRYKEPLSLETIYDGSFRDFALKELGPYKR